jgi:hypothetical protein
MRDESEEVEAKMKLCKKNGQLLQEEAKVFRGPWSKGINEVSVCTKLLLLYVPSLSAPYCLFITLNF